MKMKKKRIDPWPKEIGEYLDKVYRQELKRDTRSLNCTGMYSLSLIPERITFDAVNDELYQLVLD